MTSFRPDGVSVLATFAAVALAAASPSSAQSCTPSATVGCFLDEAVRAELEWTNDPPTALAPPHWPAQGSGTFHDLGFEDFALISFFDPETPDMIMTMIDATSFDGHYWVFASAVTDVGFTLQLTRTSDGNVATYAHPLGEVGAVIVDTGIDFTPPSAVGAVSAIAADATLCAPAALCLHGGRFEVTVEWLDHHSFPQQTGIGHPIPLSDTSGLLWFFSPTRPSLMVNVIDERARNGHFGVRVASLSDLEWTVEVRDIATGATWSHHNPRGSLLPHVDPMAIAAPQILEVPALGSGGETLLVVLLLATGLVSLRRRRFSTR